MAGFAAADSWATDCHKWLNVPYDSGLAFVREPQHLSSALTFNAAYLPSSDSREPGYYTPESSRRARVIEVWAALRSLGRKGLADMVDRNCRLAARFADKLRTAGYSILNDVVLNQVLVSFGDAAATKRVISELQNEGTCWCGGTQWHGHTAMRISVWLGDSEGCRSSAAAILRVASATPAGAR
jgi:glutamate/tyrosine decarboxylase-like PLP-dependent enzyme